MNKMHIVYVGSHNNNSHNYWHSLLPSIINHHKIKFIVNKMLLDGTTVDSLSGRVTTNLPGVSGSVLRPLSSLSFVPLLI